MNVIVAIVATAIAFILMKLKILKYSTKVLAYVTGASLLGVPIVLTIPMNYFSPGGQMYVVRNTVQIVPRVPGQVVAVYVKSGSKVKTGDPLFALDPRSYEDQVRSLEGSLADAETRAKLLGEQVQTAEAGLELARQQLTLASAEYTSAPEEQQRAAGAGVEKAKANLLMATKEMERQQQLFDKKVISAEDYDRQRQLTAIANNDYRMATSKYQESIINVSAGTQQIASAQQQVNQADSALRQAKINKDAIINGDNPLVAQTKAQLKSAQLNLEWTTVTAPMDGTVLNVQLKTGTAIGSSPVFALQDDSSTAFYVALKQSTLRHVQMGNSAEMFFDLYPGEHFAAVVTDIGRGVHEGQATATADLFSSEDLGKRSPFAVQLTPSDPKLAERLPTGAGGFASVFTEKYKPTRIPRKLLTRMSSWWKLVMP